jgi:hypothetical protein
MKVRDLIEHWEEHSAEPLAVRRYQVRLPIQDAARLAALAELYPRRNLEDLLTDLLNAALDEIEETLPYVQGTRIISEDDQGDPIYEDAGPAARFRTLTAKHARELAVEAARDSVVE